MTAAEPRGTRSGGGPLPAAVPEPGADEARDRLLDAALVRIRDLAGRPRGTGFAADHHGTLVTSHEAVAGLDRLLLDAPGAEERSCVVSADAVTALPELGLALIRTEGLALTPLPVTARGAVRPGTYVRIAAGGWREARVLGACAATYEAPDGPRTVDGVLELAIGTAGRDALRPGGGAAGGPVLDAATGAVVGVLGTALRSGGREAGFAVPLGPGRPRTPRTEAAHGAGDPLAELLARNAATVPAYGPDLNLAGAVELTATSVAQDGPAGALAHRAGEDAVLLPPLEPFALSCEGGGAAYALDAPAAHPARPVPLVERPAIAAALDAFGAGDAAVLGLVGAPGTGRTSELAALAARRARGAAPAPTLWLRGADLDGADTSVADAARRALDRAARIVAAARSPLPTEVTDLTADRLARLARAQGRPLLLLVDGPEEMPPALARRLADWTEGTLRWLRGTGARLVLACRPEYWEQAGALFPPESLHAPGTGTLGGEGAAPRPRPAAPPDTGVPLPPCLRLGDLTAEEAREARARYGVPDGALAEADARHPLTVRLLAEVRAALPGAPGRGQLDHTDVLAAHLDLVCLRIAVRLAAQNGLRGTAVRRLAAKVAGQVHEAARRSLERGHAELDRETFEEVFPWGTAPARLGGGTGWASAVLAEGLLVPAGDGYRFAHEDLADWLQGLHLDLDEALRVLVHRRHIPGEGPRPLSVPHHRIGPVVQALLQPARRYGPRRLAVRLEELMCALDGDPHNWWASRLLSGVLLRLPDATPYLRVLRLLADRIVVWQQCGLPVPHGFGPGFWTALHLPLAERCDLLRRLLVADGPPPGGTTGAHHDPHTPPPPGTGLPRHGDDGRAHPLQPRPRFLDAVAQLLAADPAAVQPHLIRWFDDERPLPATPRATVATAAQALLHTHRAGAEDELAELLAGCGHPRAGEVLAALAEEEPAVLCRAVERWARDERPQRRATALSCALRTAPHTRTEDDRAPLRRAALAVLARPADAALHGSALALLVADPHTRAAHLPQALKLFAAGDPQLPPGALAPALAGHPEAVLAAFGERLLRGPDTAEVLRALTDVTPPGLAGRVAAVLREVVARRPETADDVAMCVARRLRHGPAARPVVFPLAGRLIEHGPARLRAALGAVLAAPLPLQGTPAPDERAVADAALPDGSGPLRRELLDLLLAQESARPAGQDVTTVLDAVLRAAASTAEEDLRDLVHRVGLLLARTSDGAAAFDRSLVALSQEVPGFAARLAGWLAHAPQDWAVLVTPGVRRTIEHLAGVPVPA
ncbi:trypsin-like peptidase domain-containing protein [Streptomyces thermodiastaticus]|uniref:trypsin-like peptidase domain-containing protein n=1 Tax=Streptomyces thermodiastaticus TaxID=44061 RepID=UPI001991F868|nr:trypsin-like peptidase domain-containing protein [Streptomyces thermodiastaticus]MCE7553183.1 serine protease [Streptomyces thermodiastaticus]GHF92091.1 hypothetical protein GCM10018787_46090 [Streptomyces thermodiastaticus]